MRKSLPANPLLAAGWLRAALFVAAFIISAGSGLFLYFFWLSGKTSESFNVAGILAGDNIMLVSLFLFLAATVLTYIFRTWVDRKPFRSLGLDYTGFSKDALAGGGLALFIVGAAATILKTTGHLKWMDIIFDAKSIFLGMGTIALIAFYEELVFRGYILSNLLESFPQWVALAISAVVFMIFHWSSSGFFPLVSSLIIGLMLGMNYIYTRNLWFSICFHFVWKFMEGPLLGLAGKGSLASLVQTDINGDENITGGANGLEGSYIFMAVALLSLVALYFFMQKKISPESLPVPGRI